jgi:hypothetical protein
LTRGDLRFLASTSRDVDRKFEALESLADELVEAAEAAGVQPDFASIDDLVDGDEAGLSDPQRIDAVRADIRSQLGTIGRGDRLTTEEGTR